MKKQVSHFSIHQSSKVIAIMYFVFTALFAIPYAIFLIFSKGMTDESLIPFLVPFLYLLFGYIGTVIMLFIYNLVASTFGGIEIIVSGKELEHKETAGPE